MRHLLAILLLALPLSLHAQSTSLSDHATASLITCGAGNEFYLRFGHSAIRIVDSATGVDYAYNYGTFDFDTPHFYWNFARGMMNYCLSRTPFQLFLSTYDYEQRSVWEQPLNLSPQQVRNLYLMLEWNYQPENRYYKYDFFRDNCATRVRDMIESSLGHSSIHYSQSQAGKSYRRYVHRSVDATQQWWMLGVDLLLGLPADKPCDARDVMFHPIHMMETMQQSTFDGRSSSGNPIVAPAVQLLSDHRTPLANSIPPLAVFALLFLLVAFSTWRGWWQAWMDSLLFALAGVVGLVLCFMWFGTDHWCTRWNPNILWASPLLVLVAIRLDKSPRWALWFQQGCFLLAFVWAAVCGLSVALFPIILMLALRTAMLMRR